MELGRKKGEGGEESSGSEVWQWEEGGGEEEVAMERPKLEEEGEERVSGGCLGARKVMLVPRVSVVQRHGGCLRAGARRRCRAWKSFMHGPFGVGVSLPVDRAAIKRKHEEVKQCSPVAVEEPVHESDDSSDASEAEQRKRPRSLTLSPEEGAAELKEVQQLLELQLQAAEKREAGMKQRMEMMMDVLSQHMGQVERRVCTLERGVQPQEQVLERINVKLEQVMEGFSALNENLAILSACLSKNLEPR